MQPSDEPGNQRIRPSQPPRGQAPERPKPNWGRAQDVQKRQGSRNTAIWRPKCTPRGRDARGT
eukprot:10919618-Lingulodinium_polyedra.AAC.1